MQRSKTLLLQLVLATLLVQIAAQENIPVVAPDGGGEYVLAQSEACLSAEERAYILEQLRTQTQRLRLEGKLPAEWSENTVSLSWPLEVSPELGWPNYYGIAGFVDQFYLSNQTRDYFCGNRTYNGHGGTDFSTWPFPWYQYENDFVNVVAAAPGTIIWKQDGNDDDQCAWGNQQWNAVYVAHENGSVAWYGHLKENGLTDKNVGDEVSTGEFLGYLASSGRSTGPHLHLEIRSANEELIDPFNGDCDQQSGTVSWAEQPAYKKPSINALLTHNLPPDHQCPSEAEQTNFSNTFNLGETIYVGVYYRDQLAGTNTNFRIKDPSGTTVDFWIQILENNYNGSWWWWARNLPNGAQPGIYTVETSYQGQSEVHEFEYGVVSSTAALTQEQALLLAPNPTNGQVSWSTDFGPGTVVKLFAANGQLLDQQILSSNTYDLSKQATGLYFLQFEQGDRTLFTQRVVRKP